MKNIMKKGPAPDRADPTPSRTSGETAAAQIARIHNTPAPVGDERVREAVAAVHALSPAGRQAALAAVIAIVAVERQAEHLTPKQAGGIAHRSPETVVAWCRRFGIGRKIAGRYVIDRVRLDAFLSGENS